MAHFAKLDPNNVVTEVIVVNNDVINNEPFPQSEPIGVAFCQSLYGADTKWVQTSYNHNFRYNFAGHDYTFDASAQPNGAFIAPNPGPPYVLDTTTYRWIDPNNPIPKDPTPDVPPTVV